MKTRLILVLALVAAVACAAIAGPAFAATKTVKVGPRFRFSTSSLTIKRGDTVRFQWTGGLPHNVRMTRGPQRGTISRVRTRGVVSRRFTRTGTYRLLCDVHAPAMRMTVRVR
jgi:plastocyanin